MVHSWDLCFNAVEFYWTYKVKKIFSTKATKELDKLYKAYTGSLFYPNTHLCLLDYKENLIQAYGYI